MRKTLLAALALALLAGCLSAPATAPSQTADAQQASARPEPVDTDQVVDLTKGVNGVGWSFRVAAGAREAEVSFVVRGPNGVPAHGPVSYCLRYTADDGSAHQNGGNGACGTGNVALSVGASDLAQPQTLLRWSGGEVPTGTVAITLDTQPTAGELAVAIHIHY